MRFRDDRFGLVLIGCTLCVIVLICGLHVWAQMGARRDQNRAQGVSLIGVLSSISHERLVPQPGQQGPLDIVKTSQSNSDFAYAASGDGHILAHDAPPVVVLFPILEQRLPLAGA